jgi:hypothetical protein
VDAEPPDSFSVNRNPTTPSYSRCIADGLLRLLQVVFQR